MRKLAFGCALLIVFGSALVAVPNSSAQQRSVAALRAQLERAGEHLDRVTEQYNQARLRRAALDTKLADARHEVARSDDDLRAVQDKLGVAVRNLYMHPAAGIETYFRVRSFDEIQRGNDLAGQAAVSVDGLLLQIRKVRAERRAAVSSLEGVRAEARRRELVVAKERKDAAAALERTRSLLSGAEGALARTLAAQRRSQIAAASDLAKSRIRYAGPVRASAQIAVATARAQIGKPYRWGAAGPGAFDCSGLTMYAWRAAGVSLPHSSRAQFASLPSVPLSQLAPGDLVFSGSPIHHVGIYAGNGLMIHAPQTGETVREDSVWSHHPIGAARP